MGLRLAALENPVFRDGGDQFSMRIGMPVAAPAIGEGRVEDLTDRLGNRDHSPAVADRGRPRDDPGRARNGHVRFRPVRGQDDWPAPARE
ncbi:hypothetical protein [Halorhabdus salina]|uniref:hypothetical protein n=1 Tax=Halorhabdus salina TaxID=2750670 RepID=UPI001C683CE9|nr:hypothetical protein [Halorhabdus salina]